MPRFPNADLIALLIADVTSTSLVLGVSAFRGPIPPIDGSSAVDQLAIGVIPFGGPAAETFHSSSVSLYESHWQIQVRGERNAADSYEVAFKLALECARLLQSDGDPVMSGYIDVQLQEASPFYEGQDDQGHPVFTFNVTVQYEE